MSKDDHNFEIDLGEDLDSHSFYNAKNQSKGPGNNSSGDSRSNRGSDYSNDSQSGGNSWDGNSNQGGYNNNNFQYNKGGYQGNNYNPNYHKNNMGGGNNNFYNQAGGGQSSLNKSATPTSAILVENLNWWVNEEDVRNWVAESGQDGDLKTVIFDEHKVNGKSKGYACLKKKKEASLTPQLEWYTSNFEVFRERIRQSPTLKRASLREKMLMNFQLGLLFKPATTFHHSHHFASKRTSSTTMATIIWGVGSTTSLTMFLAVVAAGVVAICAEGEVDT